MKSKLLLSIFLFTSCLMANAQLPYSKLMGLSYEELEAGHFKYDSNKNQFVLKKSNGLNKTANILSAVNGTTADIKPHQDDYIVVRQEGDSGVSYLSVIFYKDETFHDIQTWLVENNIDILETNSGKLIIQKFNYEDYAIVLEIEKVIVSSTTGKTTAMAKSFDESYNVYTYTIYTGVEPASKWHDKEKAKKAKRDAKGKKSSLDDIM